MIFHPLIAFFECDLFYEAKQQHFDQFFNLIDFFKRYLLFISL